MKIDVQQDNFYSRASTRQIFITVDELDDFTIYLSQLFIKMNESVFAKK